MLVPYPTGLEPKNDQDPASVNHESEIHDQEVLRMIVFRLIADAVMGGSFFLFARQTGRWQFNQVAIFAFVLVGIDFLGLILARRGRGKLGAQLVMIGLWIVLPIVTILISGLGVFLGLSVVILTALSAIQTLTPRLASRMIMLSVLSGFLIPLLDIFLPVGQRAPVPDVLQTAFPLIIGILLAFYGLIIARQFPSYTLQTKLVIAFLVVSLLPLGSLSYLNDRINRNALTDAANQALFAAASETATTVDTFITANLEAVQNEAQNPLFREYISLPPNDRSTPTDAAEITELLRSFQKKDPEHILNYLLLDEEAKILADLSGSDIGQPAPLMDLDPSSMKAFLDVLTNDLPIVTPVKYAPQTGAPGIFFFARVSDLEGTPIGGLITHYDANVLQKLVESNNGLAGADSFGVLLDDFNIHLAHGTSTDALFKSVAPLNQDQLSDLQNSYRLPELAAEELTTDLPTLNQKLNASNNLSFFSTSDPGTGDRENQVAVANLDTQTWKVAFFQPQDIFLAPAAQQTRISLIFSVVFTTMVIFAALGAARFVASPISRLTKVATRVAEGDLSTRMPVETNDEVGTLALTFNTMTDQLEQILAGLEQKVTDRTKDLERRATQLETASFVSREAASIRNINQLLDETTHLISQRFGYYHCGIFLIDEPRQYAVLQAANSAGGKQMLARGHQLSVGKLGIVGYVADSREPRIALDVGADAVFFDNPDLPETRSEIALPMMIKDRVLGVLDVQSRKPNAFSEEDIEVLQILADQITLAIDNARLLETSQHSLQELENLYRLEVHQSWKQRLVDRHLAYRYNRVGVELLPSTETLPSELEGRQNGGESEFAERNLYVPIKIRDQIIGSILLRREVDQNPWSQDDLKLVQEIVQQMGLALENTRLNEETRWRADRERLMAEVSTRMRESLDLNTVLQTAVREIGEALGVPEVVIRMGTMDEDFGSD